MANLKRAHTQSWATYVVAGFLIVAVIIGISIGYFSFAKTVVTITPQPQPYTATIDIPLNQIEGEILSTEKSGNLTYTDISSEKEEQDFATGTVTIKNESNRDQPLVATTRLLSTQGVLFRTQTNTTVPAGGSVDVEVKADQAGAQGNIDPSRFEIVALHASAKEKIYGVSSEPMRGGVKKTGVLTAADLKKASEQLYADLVDQVIADLITQAQASGKDSVVREDTIHTDITSSTQSAEPGDTVNSLDLTETIQATTIAFDAQALESIINTQATAQAPEGTQTFTLPKNTYSFSLANEETAPDQPITVRVTLTATSVITLSSPLLDRSRIINNDEQEIKTYFSNFEEVKDVQVTFRPFWIKRAPALIDHIVIEIAAQASASTE